MGFFYIVSFADAIHDNRFKIGVTSNPSVRSLLSRYRTYGDCILIAFFSLGPLNIFHYESLIKDSLSECRMINGLDTASEWVRIRYESLVLVIKAVIMMGYPIKIHSDHFIVDEPDTMIDYRFAQIPVKFRRHIITPLSYHEFEPEVNEIYQLLISPCEIRTVNINERYSRRDRISMMRYFSVENENDDIITTTPIYLNINRELTKPDNKIETNATGLQMKTLHVLNPETPDSQVKTLHVLSPETHDPQMRTLHVSNPEIAVETKSQLSQSKSFNSVNILKKLVPKRPNNINFSKTGGIYETFATFMMNPTHIRYGISEKVVTWRLVSLFNNVTGQNISFNSTFPTLMARFIQEHPNFNISKKLRKDGTTYLGIGLTTDDISRPKGLSITPQVNSDYKKQKEKEKNDRRALKNQVIATTLKETILQRTQWTESQYSQLINLGLIPVYRNGKEYCIESMIEATRGRIIEFTHNKIDDLNNFAKTANLVKLDLLRAINEDGISLKNNKFHPQTQRLKIAESTHKVGDILYRRINSYNNVMQDLPRINHIVYPDIQYLTDLANWLKENSMYQTRKGIYET